MPQTKSSEKDTARNENSSRGRFTTKVSEAEKMYEMPGIVSVSFLLPAALAATWRRHRWLIMQPKLETKPLSHLRIYISLHPTDTRDTLFFLATWLLQKVRFVWKLPDFPAHWSTRSAGVPGTRFQSAVTHPQTSSAIPQQLRPLCKSPCQQLQLFKAAAPLCCHHI